MATVVKYFRIISSKYKYTNQDGLNPQDIENIPMTFNGTTEKGGIVSLTIAKGFIQGFISLGEETYYIEPFRNFNMKGNKDDVVIYNVKDINKSAPVKCGFTAYKNELLRTRKKHNKRTNQLGLCYDIEYAIASDYSMFIKYGASGLQARNIAILNDVNTNYQSDFQDEIRFVLTGQYVSDCANCDPWSSSLDFSTLLNSFRNWGNQTIGNPNSNQFISYDIASLWSDRWTNSLVIGQAYLGGLCTEDRYNVLSDFSSNSNALRVLLAHEIGHNLNAFHDASGSGTIMAPIINVTNTWSTSSINAINNQVSNSSCLAFCDDFPTTVYWDSPVLNLQEISTNLDAETCMEYYADYEIPVKITNAPANTVVVGIEAIGTTAQANIDFELITNSVSFSPLGPLSKEVTIRIYDDYIIENSELLELKLDVVSGSAQTSTVDKVLVNIVSDDTAVSEIVSAGDTFFYGNNMQLESSNGFFEGSRTDVRTRFLISADRLNEMGMIAGNIDMLSFFVFEKNSIGIYQNFRLGMTSTPNNDLQGLSWLSTSPVFQGSVQTSEFAWSAISFSTPYYWNGISNIYVDMCYDNSSPIGDDKIILFRPETDGQGQLYSYSSNELDNCGPVSSQGWIANRSPVVLLRQKREVTIEDYAINSGSSHLKTGETAVFYSSRGFLIGTLENIGSSDLECVEVSIRSEGIGRANLDFGNGFHSDKSVRVKIDNNGNYRLTIYYNQQEMNIWQSAIPELKMIISEVPITSAAINQSTIQQALSYKIIPDAESAHSFSIESSGTKYFAIVNWEPPIESLANISCTLKEAGLSLNDINSGFLLSNLMGDQYVVRLNSIGNILFFKNTIINPTSSLEMGDLYIESNAKTLNIATIGNTEVNLFIDANGNIDRSQMQSPTAQNITIDSGYFELSEPGAGIIFKNTDNECYKIFVDNDAVLRTGLVVCP